MKREKKRWLNELPYIRGIAALGILIIHATGGFVVFSEFGSRAMNLGIFLNQFFRFGSPVFMMISGMVIFYNYRSKEDLDIGRFYRKKLRYIFIPYILWNLIYFFYGRGFDLSGQALVSLFKDILLGSGHDHLYFIFLIFQFYILVPWFLTFLPKEMEERPYRLLVISFIFQFLVISYGRYFKLSTAEGFIGLFNRIYWKTALAWQYYFILGGTIGVHYFKVLDWVKENRKKVNLGFFIASALYVGQVYLAVYREASIGIYDKFGSLRPTTMVFASVSILYFLALTNKFVGRKRVLKDIGVYSFGIYFSHPLILEALRSFFFKFPSVFSYMRISSLVIFLISGLLLSLLIVFFLASLRSRKLIMGNVPKFTLARWRKEE